MPRARLSRSVSGAVAVDPAELGGDATSPATPTRSRATRDLHPGAARISREDLVDALTCPVSGKLFVDPVTTVCGHSFSRRCLSTWMARTDRAPSCPTCRAPLYHENPRRWPVNTTLVDLVERFLGDELADARASEPGDGLDVGDGRGPGAGPAESELSLFVLDAITPGQEITLNVFEERYKLMVRRCLQGSRRFGMVGLIRDENDARRDEAYSSGDDSSGDDSPRRNPTDGSDDDDDMTERARSSEISPPRAGGSEMRPRRSRAPRRSRVRSSPRRSVRSVRSVRRRWRRVRDRRAPGTRRRSSPRPVSREAPRASLGREGRPRRGGVPRRARGTRRGRRGGGARRENSREGGTRRDARPSRCLRSRCLPHIDAVDRASRGARGSSAGFDRSSRGGSARLGDDGVTGRTRHRDASDVVGARRGSPRGAWVFGCGVVFHRVSVPAQLFTSIVQRRRG